MLALRGRPLPATDRRVLGAFAAYAATALEQERLAAAAEAARPIAAADRMRTALLAAVSHDLRTPLASAKAAVTSLRATDVQWTPEDRDELLATADESLDRLAHLVDNLLDMSRLQAGALAVFPRPGRSGRDRGPRPGRPRPGRPHGRGGHPRATCPRSRVDPGILERVIANLTAQRAALLARRARRRCSAAARSATGSSCGSSTAGPAFPEADRDRMFVPFQRLGDTDNTTGVGLGLALSRGLTEAMGGTLEPEETPGGGLTMALSLPAGAARAPRVPAAAPSRARPRQGRAPTAARRPRAPGTRVR